MNLRQIEVFRAVMQAGSLSGAAAALHVSQPAVSRLVRYLEVKLAVSLFERSGGRLHATPEAHALKSQIDSVYSGIDRVRSFASQLRFGVADTLRVASNLSTGLELVPRAIAELKLAMPRLHISVDIETQEQITRQLLAGECDIGVVSFVQSRHPGIQVHPIGRGEVLCAMAPGHELAAHKRVKRALIGRPDMISFGSERPHGRQLSELLNTPEPIIPTVDVRYAYLACNIAAGGWGFAVVDDLTVASLRGAADRLVLRPLDEPLHYEACALSAADRPLSGAGREMVRLLQRCWGGLLGKPVAAQAQRKSARKT